MPSQNPLLGMGSINVGGHKVPYALIGAAAGVVGVVLVLRARKGGGNVVAAGQPSGAPAMDQASQFGNFGPDYSAALANQSQQLSDLSALIQGFGQTPGTGTTPAPQPAPQPTPAPQPAPSPAPSPAPAPSALPVAHILPGASWFDFNTGTPIQFATPPVGATVNVGAARGGLEQIIVGPNQSWAIPRQFLQIG